MPIVDWGFVDIEMKMKNWGVSVDRVMNCCVVPLEAEKSKSLCLFNFSGNAHK